MAEESLTIEEMISKIEKKLPEMWCWEVSSWKRNGSLYTMAKLSYTDGPTIKTQIVDSPYFGYQSILSYLTEQENRIF